MAQLLMRLDCARFDKNCSTMNTSFATSFTFAISNDDSLLCLPFEFPEHRLYLVGREEHFSDHLLLGFVHALLFLSKAPVELLIVFRGFETAIGLGACKVVRSISEKTHNRSHGFILALILLMRCSHFFSSSILFGFGDENVHLLNLAAILVWACLFFILLLPYVLHGRCTSGAACWAV